MRIIWAFSVLPILVATVLAEENGFLRVKNEPSIEQVRRAVMENVNPGLERKKYDPRIMFNADVALPAGFKTAFQKDSARFEALDGKPFPKMSVSEETQQGVGFVTGGDRRHLQNIALLSCFPEDDGNIFCVGDDYPSMGLITVFVCPEGAMTADQCNWCFIFWEDEPENITTATPTCTDCGVCSTSDSVDYSFNCSNISPEDPCASQDCSGNCTDSDGSLCFEKSDGSHDCVIEDIPNDELVLVFTGCNLTTSNSIFDCPTCEIVESESYSNIANTSARCNSCSVCQVEMNVAFDCSNFDDVDPCAVQSCNSTCLGPSEPDAPSAPTPAPVPSPTENLCYIQSNGLYDCVIEDAPRNNLTTVFTGCNLTTATSVFDCPMCYIADADSYLGITNTTALCNSCAVCDSQPNVAFDCVNIDPGEVCAIRDCDSSCLNLDQLPSPPSTSRSYNFDSPAQSPSPTSGTTRVVFCFSIAFIVVATVLLW